MRKEIYDLSRGEFGRKVYGDGRIFSSISQPIQELMEKVNGAELVGRCKKGIGDEYHGNYFVSPESVSVGFDVELQVHIMATGTSLEAISKVREKIFQAFTKPNSI